MRRSIEERLWEKIDVKGEDDCWPWLAGTSSDGYGVFMVRTGYQTSAHRVVLMLHNPIEGYEKLDSCHTCDSPSCCNPKHLFWGTRKENIRDMIKKGRMPQGEAWNHPPQRGEQNHAAILDESRIREMKELLRTGQKQSDIARAFGVTRGYVWSVAHGKSWKHVQIT